MSARSIVTRVRGLLRKVRPAPASIHWSQIERFEELWIDRIRQMAMYIPQGGSVMDLGCGPMWLRKLVPNSGYIPIDYVDRGPGTIICDFNRYEFPDAVANVAFVSGCLEYVNDAHWFVEKIAQHSRFCIASYCTIENFSDLKQRRSLGWVNDFAYHDIITLFEAHGFVLSQVEMTSSENTIFIFDMIK